MESTSPEDDNSQDHCGEARSPASQAQTGVRDTTRLKERRKGTGWKGETHAKGGGGRKGRRGEGSSLGRRCSRHRKRRVVVAPRGHVSCAGTPLTRAFNSWEDLKDDNLTRLAS